MTNYREILDELDISTSAGAGPAGADGDWQQLLAAFGTRGFLRALTDGHSLVLECAPPADPEATKGAAEAAGWEVSGDVPFVATRPFPESADSMRGFWVVISKLAEATTDESADRFLEALTSSQGDEDVPEPVPSDAAESEGTEDAPSGGAFESIGEGEPEPAPAAAAPQAASFLFAIARDGGAVHAALGFAEKLDPQEHDNLEARLVSNLRGKHDVDVKPVGAPDIVAKLERVPGSRVSLQITAAVGAKLSVRQIEDAVGEYFATIRELASAGIDPLVFLGVRASKRSTGAFESIGKATPQPAQDEEPQVLFVADEDDEDEPDDAPGEVVFGDDAPVDPDAPLEPGRYDDSRLKRLDATTTLVDVVLRHPGYSDRNIGQVLSILLSTDYANCLSIAEHAPTVIAWGVARERALTMKTVIEGAGGKVVLVEPGTFGED